MRPDYMFVDSCQGDLHDTRQANWHKMPLRKGFMRSYSRIRNAAQFKATLRAGGRVWPGGYPLYLTTSDGAVLCFKCARKECRNIIDSIQRKASDGWRVVGCDVNYEDNALFCDNCSEKIESAYGED